MRLGCCAIFCMSSAVVFSSVRRVRPRAYRHARAMERSSLFAVLAFAVALLAADAPVAFGADGSCAAAAPSSWLSDRSTWTRHPRRSSSASRRDGLGDGPRRDDHHGRQGRESGGRRRAPRRGHARGEVRRRLRERRARRRRSRMSSAPTPWTSPDSGRPAPPIRTGHRHALS